MSKKGKGRKKKEEKPKDLELNPRAAEIRDGEELGFFNRAMAELLKE